MRSHGWGATAWGATGCDPAGWGPAAHPLSLRAPDRAEEEAHPAHEAGTRAASTRRGSEGGGRVLAAPAPMLSRAMLDPTVRSCMAGPAHGA